MTRMPNPSPLPSPPWASTLARNTFHLVGLDKRGAIARSSGLRALLVTKPRDHVAS